MLPPIGAQGLNLGIRDAAQLAELVADLQGDPGADELLHEYDRSRGADVRGRAMFVDFTNRSLMSDFLPLHAARGLGSAHRKPDVEHARPTLVLDHEFVELG